MPVFVTECPQNVAEIKTVALKDIVKILPNSIPQGLNVWIAGKIVQFGMTDGNLVFLVESDKPVPKELMQMFNDFVAPIGIQATVSNGWKNQKFAALRLYDQGKLIIDKDTLEYTSIPSAVKEAVIITCKEILEKLPDSVPWEIDLYLTGGIVRCGWSANDLDIMSLRPLDRLTVIKIKDFFTEIFGWKTDVGYIIMKEREPVYLFKIYEKGKRCQS